MAGTAALAGASTGNIPALLIGGGLDLVLSILSGFGEEDMAKMDRDTKLKIAADTLGFDYAQLKQQSDQFQKNFGLETQKFMADKKINQQSLAEKIRSNMAGEQLTGQKQQTESRFGLSDRYNQIGQERQQEQRRSDIRGSLATPKEPQPAAPTSMPGKPTVAQQPTASPLMPPPTPSAQQQQQPQSIVGSANKDAGLNVMQSTGAQPGAKYIYQPGVAQA